MEYVINSSIKERQYKLGSTRHDWKAFCSEPRVYIQPNGETLIDNLFNRRHRPIGLFRDIAKRALAQQGVVAPKLRWSQYAGCSCPCSPGFILIDYTTEEGHKLPDNRKFDVHVNFESK